MDAKIGPQQRIPVFFFMKRVLTPTILHTVSKTGKKVNFFIISVTSIDILLLLSATYLP